MRLVRLPAFAKINLCLHVLGKRPDGYHELRTVLQTISLHDDLEIAPMRGPGIELEVKSTLDLSEEESAALRSPQNLVCRAVDVLRRELGVRTGVRVRLVKRIPLARGLGGGSSDAAAALVGLLRVTGQKLPGTGLLELAAGLGADVPFFLFGGRALGVSRGDEIYPFPDLPRRSVVVVSPREIAVSTREAYAWLRRGLTKSGGAPRLWGFCALCWSTQERPTSNDFEAVVFRRHPRLARIKRGLLQRGAMEAALAGSGSAAFGIFRNPAQARRAAHGFPNEQVFVCTTVSREEYDLARRGAAIA